MKTVADELKAYIEDLAQSWPDSDADLVARKASIIEAEIPPDSTDPNAVEALDHAKRAREFGLSEKGWYQIGQAQTALALYLMTPDVIKAELFSPGKRKGAKAANTKHIENLALNNPSLRAKNLYALADKSILGNMTIGTFSNKVTNARRKPQG